MTEIRRVLRSQIAVQESGHALLALRRNMFAIRDTAEGLAAYNNPSSGFGSRRSGLGSSRGFTLIEIMIAIAIAAIIMAIGIPSVYQRLHEDSMRKALADVQEAINQARTRAVLDGVATELKIRPADRTITVVAGVAPVNTTGSSMIDGEPGIQTRSASPVGGGGGTIFSMKFSDHIIIEYVGVELDEDLRLNEEIGSLFYPNGTADTLVLLLRSDMGEVRQITVDSVTGIPDVEVKR